MKLIKTELGMDAKLYPEEVTFCQSDKWDKEWNLFMILDNEMYKKGFERDWDGLTWIYRHYKERVVYCLKNEQIIPMLLGEQVLLKKI